MANESGWRGRTAITTVETWLYTLLSLSLSLLQDSRGGGIVFHLTAKKRLQKGYLWGAKKKRPARGSVSYPGIV